MISIREFIEDQIGLALILSWLLLSAFYINDPSSFQRLGAYGVATGILALSLQAQFARARSAKLIDDGAETKLAFDASQFEFQLAAHRSACELIRRLSNGQTDVNFHDQLATLEKAIEKAEEIKVRPLLGYEARETRIGWVKLKLEILTVVLATLQAGFGDMIGYWLRGS